MGVEFASERRLLSEAELQPVRSSHYPGLADMARDDLISLRGWLRQQRARARDIIHERRRLRRGKGEPRGGAAEPTRERGLAAKKQVFARALKRVNTRIAHHDAAAKGRARLHRCGQHWRCGGRRRCTIPAPVRRRTSACAPGASSRGRTS